MIFAVVALAGCQSVQLPEGSQKTAMAPTVTGIQAIQLSGATGIFHAKVPKGQAFSVTLPGGEAEGYGGYDWVMRDVQGPQVVKVTGQRAFVEPSTDLNIPAYYDFPFLATGAGQQTLVFDLVNQGAGARAPARTATLIVIIGG